MAFGTTTFGQAPYGETVELPAQPAPHVTAPNLGLPPIGSPSVIPPPPGTTYTLTAPTRGSIIGGMVSSGTVAGAFIGTSTQTGHATMTVTGSAIAPPAQINAATTFLAAVSAVGSQTLSVITGTGSISGSSTLSATARTEARTLGYGLTNVTGTLAATNITTIPKSFASASIAGTASLVVAAGAAVNSPVGTGATTALATISAVGQGIAVASVTVSLTGTATLALTSFVSVNANTTGATMLLGSTEGAAYELGASDSPNLVAEMLVESTCYADVFRVTENIRTGNVTRMAASMALTRFGVADFSVTVSMAAESRVSAMDTSHIQAFAGVAKLASNAQVILAAFRYIPPPAGTGFAFITGSSAMSGSGFQEPTSAYALGERPTTTTLTTFAGGNTALAQLPASTAFRTLGRAVFNTFLDDAADLQATSACAVTGFAAQNGQSRLPATTPLLAAGSSSLHDAFCLLPAHTALSAPPYVAGFTDVEARGSVRTVLHCNADLDSIAVAAHLFSSARTGPCEPIAIANPQPYFRLSARAFLAMTFEDHPDRGQFSMNTLRGRSQITAVGDHLARVNGIARLGTQTPFITAGLVLNPDNGTSRLRGSSSLGAQFTVTQTVDAHLARSFAQTRLFCAVQEVQLLGTAESAINLKSHATSDAKAEVALERTHSQILRGRSAVLADGRSITENGASRLLAHTGFRADGVGSGGGEFSAHAFPTGRSHLVSLGMSALVSAFHTPRAQAHLIVSPIADNSGRAMFPARTSLTAHFTVTPVFDVTAADSSTSTTMSVSVTGGVILTAANLASTSSTTSEGQNIATAEAQFCSLSAASTFLTAPPVVVNPVQIFALLPTSTSLILTPDLFAYSAQPASTTLVASGHVLEAYAHASLRTNSPATFLPPTPESGNRPRSLMARARLAFRPFTYHAVPRPVDAAAALSHSFALLAVEVPDNPNTPSPTDKFDFPEPNGDDPVDAHLNLTPAQTEYLDDYDMAVVSVGDLDFTEAESTPSPPASEMLFASPTPRSDFTDNF